MHTKDKHRIVAKHPEPICRQEIATTADQPGRNCQREKLERLCRYVSRPPVASERLALTASGQVRYTLKTPYRDGTTHIVLEPLDLMARLAALVPTPASSVDPCYARNKPPVWRLRPANPIFLQTPRLTPIVFQDFDSRMRRKPPRRRRYF